MKHISYQYFVFFIGMSLSLFGSNLLEKLHEHHWQSVQKHLSYIDFFNILALNKRCNELFKLFNEFIKERLKKDLSAAKVLDGVLFNLCNECIEQEKTIRLTKNNIINEKLKEICKQNIKMCFDTFPFYRQYVQGIRCSYQKDYFILKEKIKEYCTFADITLESKRLQNIEVVEKYDAVQLISDVSGKDSIVVIELDDEIIFDIPSRVFLNYLKKHLKRFSCDKRKFVLVFSDGYLPSKDLLKNIRTLLPFENLRYINMSFCSDDIPYETFKELAIELFKNIEIRINQNMMERFIVDYLVYDSLPDQEKTNRMLTLFSQCVDENRLNYHYYLSGLKNINHYLVKSYVFLNKAQCAKDSLNHIKEKNDKIILPLFKDNLTKTVLENIKFSLSSPIIEAEKDPFEYCDTFMKLVDPHYIWPYMYVLKQNNDPILERTKEDFFSPFFTWLDDAQKEHSKAFGFNLYGHIAHYVLKNCFSENT